MGSSLVNMGCECWYIHTSVATELMECGLGYICLKVAQPGLAKTYNCSQDLVLLYGEFHRKENRSIHMLNAFICFTQNH